ncbi:MULTISPECIES: L-fucose isomerase [Bacteroides]|jgi:L-fucose isomerase|uniref:L-fucose isomerase n=1 Tax=Bacteroides TaxID=816 RepID=UPI000E430A30|nr:MULTISPECIES: L-fucose isomerase [Bacteroides]MBS7575284.1 L-fucose isomerase [Bacteroides propionicigenes]RGM30226.1 L-fucose isomerase [Bacteroides sp. OM08-17BH]HBO07660.1 L-fucose isomerase [Bacteroides sp.]
MKNLRLIGSKAKIGIRPIIDGRRGGIRESLEDITMTMARKVAELYSSSLYHSDGTPVECIIADATIGGVAEAAMAAEKFRNNGVGVILSVTPCWCYGFETIDMDSEIPKAIWGFNGTERPGAVYLASALAGHTQKGLPAFGIYGQDVQDIGNTEMPEDVREKLLRFARAGLAVAAMKGKSYLSIGSVSMGIAGSIPNPDFFQEYLGMRNEYVDASEIERRIQLGIYDYEEFERAMIWTEKYCKSNEGCDFNPKHLVYSREEKNVRWEYVVKMTLIFRDLMIGNPKLAEIGFKEEAMGHNAIAAGFQGQRQWTDYKPDGDFSEAILNSSFDWNGIREAFTFATENDTLNCVSMLFGHLLSNTAQIFADVRTYWSPHSIERVTGKKPEGKASNGFIHLINSGSCTLDGTGCMQRDGKPVMKPFWEISEEDVERCLAATKWYPASREYMRGGGFSSQFLTRGEMPLTMCRLNLVKGQGPVLQIAEGWAVNLDDDVFRIINDRTDRTWPSTFFVPRLTGKGYFRDVYTVMNNWGANHGAISYGHIGADLVTLASMLRIPVSMHNIPFENVFRPSAWSAFGEDMEGSDYRACKNYGPLYK